MGAGIDALPLRVVCREPPVRVVNEISVGFNLIQQLKQNSIGGFTG